MDMVNLYEFLKIIVKIFHNCIHIHKLRTKRNNLLNTYIKKYLNEKKILTYMYDSSRMKLHTCTCCSNLYSDTQSI